MGSDNKMCDIKSGVQNKILYTMSDLLHKTLYYI